MHETYRMLGREHDLELERLAGPSRCVPKDRKPGLRIERLARLATAVALVPRRTQPDDALTDGRSDVRPT